jgi:hypothetical protein
MVTVHEFGGGDTASWRTLSTVATALQTASSTLLCGSWQANAGEADSTPTFTMTREETTKSLRNLIPSPSPRQHPA